MKSDYRQLPNGWAVTPLDQVCDILDQVRVPVNARERARRIEGKSASSLYPYYGATGQVGYIDDYLFEGEHVLIGEDGAPFLEPFRDKAYVVSKRFWVNNHAHILKAHVSNKYLAYYLNSISYSGHVTGTTRLKLTKGALRQLPVLLAPANEQHRIVAKLEELFSELDKGVESLNAAAEQLRAYRQALYDQATSGALLVSRGVCAEPFNDAMWKPISEVICGLGQGWSPRCLGQPSPSDVLWAVMTTTAIQHGSFDDAANKQLPDHLQPRPQLSIAVGDVLVTRAGPRKRVGVACLVRRCRPRLMLCDKAYRLRADLSKVLPEWLELTLNAPSILQDIERLKTGINDSGVNLTQDGFLALRVPVPPLEFQRSALALVDANASQAASMMSQIETSRDRAESLRVAILRKAFSGQLVGERAGDEPASALLEHIRAEGGGAVTRQRGRHSTRKKEAA
jgi:type I restriction enzyme, S subunit